MVRARPAEVMGQVRPEPDQIWDAGSVQLASWILTEANEHAAEIRYEARDQAATSLADAKQEAAERMRQASDHAAATVAAAEIRAAEIRAAAVMKLSTDLGKLASYVTENLLTDAPPATRPIARPPAKPVTEPVTMPTVDLFTEPVTRPAAEPATRPAARPATRPAAEPVTRPAGRPVTRPTVKPKARPEARPTRTGPAVQPADSPKGRHRQYRAMRVAVIATAALVTFALVSGITEVALHGFPFFIFRSVGTGETGPNGLQEDQGPGQADAPGAHTQLHNP